MRDIIEKQGMRSCLGMGILFSILSAVTYGLNPIFAKLGYAAQLSGIEILQSRFLFAVMTLAIAGPFLEDGFYRFSKSLLIKSLFIGLIVLLPLNLLYVYALKDIPASMMSLITYVYPVIILLVNGIVFHKKIQASQIVSVALIVLACVCIFSDALRSRITLTALAIGFLSTFMYAAYLLSLQQLAENVSAYKITFLTLLFASLGLCFFHNPVSVLSLNAEQLALLSATAWFRQYCPPYSYPKRSKCSARRRQESSAHLNRYSPSALPVFSSVNIFRHSAGQAWFFWSLRSSRPTETRLPKS